MTDDWPTFHRFGVHKGIVDWNRVNEHDGATRNLNMSQDGQRTYRKEKGHCGGLADPFHGSTESAQGKTPRDNTEMRKKISESVVGRRKIC